MIQVTPQMRVSVVYHNDAVAGERNLSPEDRLLFHQAQSGPPMEELHVWLVRQFDQRRVEPNSALGGAISHLLKRWEKLTLLLRVPGRRWTTISASGH